MFVVAPIIQVAVPPGATPGKHYPVVFEDVESGYAHPAVAYRDSREAAGAVADALNAALASTAEVKVVRK